MCSVESPLRDKEFREISEKSDWLLHTFHMWKNFYKLFLSQPEGGGASVACCLASSPPPRFFVPSVPGQPHTPALPCQFPFPVPVPWTDLPLLCLLPRVASATSRLEGANGRGFRSQVSPTCTTWGRGEEVGRYRYSHIPKQPACSHCVPPRGVAALCLGIGSHAIKVPKGKERGVGATRGMRLLPKTKSGEAR